MLDGNKVLYLAGAKFNPCQAELYCTVEKMLENLGIQWFSPYREAAGMETAKATSGNKAYQIFEGNCDDIDACDAVLAIVPFLSAPGQDLCIRSIEGGRATTLVTDLTLPDTGVVWEMGYAFAKGKPIFGFFEGCRQPNLMLAQCCAGIAVDLSELKLMLQMLAPFKGLLQ